MPPGSSIGKGPAWKGGPEIDGVLTRADGTIDDGAGAETAEFATTQQSPAYFDEGPRRARGNTHNGIIGHYAPAGGFLKYPGVHYKSNGENTNLALLSVLKAAGLPLTSFGTGASAVTASLTGIEA